MTIVEEIKELIKKYSKEINIYTPDNLYLFLKNQSGDGYLDNYLTGMFFILYGVNKNLKFAETTDGDSYNLYLIPNNSQAIKLFQYSNSPMHDWSYTDKDFPKEIYDKAESRLVPFPAGVEIIEKF